MKDISWILERHEINSEHQGLLEKDLENFGQSRFDEGFQAAQTQIKETAKAEKQTLLKALQNFINPNGHTTDCLELREKGQTTCPKNCQAAREAIEQISGQKINSKI